MTDRWETLAQEDAEFYIWTDVARGDDFFASGERDAARIMEAAGPHLTHRGRAVEIGCGVGRMTIPMSRQFGEVIAVDIAPTMLSKLAANCQARGVMNVTPMLADAGWDAVGPVDFAYSRIVFQHIERWESITEYLRRIGRRLTPGGVIYAQFDTRPPTVAYHVKNALPDAVLPRNFRRGVRRIRRAPEVLLATLRELRLAPVVQRGVGTEDTELVLRRDGATSM